jgi:hypothetical protein
MKVNRLNGELVHSSTVRNHFLKKMVPSDELQKLVTIAVREISSSSPRRLRWMEAAHSYTAFSDGNVPISAPLALRVNKPETSNAVPYNGNYLLLRKNFKKTIVAEWMKLTTIFGRPGTYDLDLFMREGGNGESVGRSFIQMQGNVHITIRSIWGYAARISPEGDHECLSVMLGRNANNSTALLSGIILRRSSTTGFPVGQNIVAIKRENIYDQQKRETFLSRVEAQQGIKKFQALLNEVRGDPNPAHADVMELIEAL